MASPRERPPQSRHVRPIGRDHVVGRIELEVILHRMSHKGRQLIELFWRIHRGIEVQTVEQIYDLNVDVVLTHLRERDGKKDRRRRGRTSASPRNAPPGGFVYTVPQVHPQKPSLALVASTRERSPQCCAAGDGAEIKNLQISLFHYKQYNGHTQCIAGCHSVKLSKSANPTSARQLDYGGGSHLPSWSSRRRFRW